MSALAEIEACRCLVEELARLADIRVQTLRRFAPPRRAPFELAGLALALWGGWELARRAWQFTLPIWLAAAGGIALALFGYWRVRADEKRTAVALESPESRLILTALERRIAGVRRRLLASPVPAAFHELTALAALEREALAGETDLAACIARCQSALQPQSDSYEQGLTMLGLKKVSRRDGIGRLRLSLWRERRR